MKKAAIGKGTRHNVDITGLNHEGQGVGRIDGFAVFVDGTVPGEKVDTQITQVKSNYCVGKAVRVIVPSERRVEPFCAVYGKCGGCSLQHIEYAEQLRLKTEMVRDALQRIGKLDTADIVIHDTAGMKRSLHYRNKAQYPVGLQTAPDRNERPDVHDKSGRPDARDESGRPEAGAAGITDAADVAIGFYSRMSHDIVDFSECAIQIKACDIVKETVRDFIERNSLSIYDEVTGKGLVRHIVARVASRSGDVMAIVVINGGSLPQSDKLIRLLLKRVSKLKSVFLNINTEPSNIIFGSKFVRLYGQAFIEEHIGDYVFRLSPSSFYQVNPDRMKYLYEKAIEYAGLNGTEAAADIFCGIGTLTLLLAEKAAKVYGIEVSAEAVKDARLNASLNAVSNVEFICAEAEAGFKQLIQILDSEKKTLDVVILDPPRKGCSPELLETVSASAPPKIVYISCNPATLARDLAFLAEKGYAAVEVQPVDMFPYTPHVETVVRLERKHIQDIAEEKI